MVTYETARQRLTPQRTECKHHLFDAALNLLQDRICMQTSLGGAKSFSVISLCAILQFRAS